MSGGQNANTPAIRSAPFSPSLRFSAIRYSRYAVAISASVDGILKSSAMPSEPYGIPNPLQSAERAPLTYI